MVNDSCMAIDEYEWLRARVAELEGVTPVELPEAGMSEADCFLLEAALNVAKPCNDDGSELVIKDTDLVKLIRCALDRDFSALYPG